MSMTANILGSISPASDAAVALGNHHDFHDGTPELSGWKGNRSRSFFRLSHSSQTGKLQIDINFQNFARNLLPTNTFASVNCGQKSGISDSRRAKKRRLSSFRAKDRPSLIRLDLASAVFSGQLAQLRSGRVRDGDGPPGILAIKNRIDHGPSSRLPVRPASRPRRLDLVDDRRGINSLQDRVENDNLSPVRLGNRSGLGVDG